MSLLFHYVHLRIGHATEWFLLSPSDAKLNAWSHQWLFIDLLDGIQINMIKNHIDISLWKFSGLGVTEDANSWHFFLQVNNTPNNLSFSIFFYFGRRRIHGTPFSVLFNMKFTPAEIWASDLMIL